MIRQEARGESRPRRRVGGEIAREAGVGPGARRGLEDRSKRGGCSRVNRGCRRRGSFFAFVRAGTSKWDDIPVPQCVPTDLPSPLGSLFSCACSQSRGARFRCGRPRVAGHASAITMPLPQVIPECQCARGCISGQSVTLQTQRSRKPPRRRPGTSQPAHDNDNGSEMFRPLPSSFHSTARSYSTACMEAGWISMQRDDLHL